MMNFCAALPRSALSQRLTQSTSQSFSTSTSLSAESKRKRLARLRKSANISRRAQTAQEQAATAPDLILGYNPTLEQGKQLWQDSKLAKILLKPEEVWGTSVAEARKSSGSMPSLDEGLEPEQTSTVDPQTWNFGLTTDEAQLLFDALPATNASRLTSTDPAALEQGLQVEQDKTDQLKRILDLRNASAKGVAVENTRRIVEAFGRHQGDTGTPEVQAALLTSRIHALRSHLIFNHKDIVTQQSLRHLVHQRVKVFRYLKDKSLTRWSQALADCGLDERAVKGEITLDRAIMKGLKTASA